jgi:hypothetical protein
MEGDSPQDQAGFSVSISEDGNTVAVGARRSSPDGLFNRGSVKVYQFEFNQWFEIGNLNGRAERNQFGFSTAISADGNRVAVGSVGDDQNGVNSGMVEIFERQGSVWKRVGVFLGEGEGDIFGASVAISANGRLVAIGAPYRNLNGSARRGEVFFYEDIGFDTPRWVKTRASLQGSGENDYYGWSLSLSTDGYRVAIGAPKSDERNEPGYVRIFRFTGIADQWVQLGHDIRNGENGDRYGYSVSMNGMGNRVAVGAFRGMNVAGLQSGKALVYNINGPSWSVLGEALFGETALGNFGYDVSLSTDGDFLAVGAPEEETDMGSGKVNVYTLAPSGLWVSSEPIMTEAVETRLGFSVSITPNATRLAVGLPLANQGRVYHTNS